MLAYGSVDSSKDGDEEGDTGNHSHLSVSSDLPRFDG